MIIQTIIGKFGGIRSFARILSMPPQTVSSWKARNSIPAKHQKVILDAAKRNGIKLKPDDFFAD